LSNYWRQPSYRSRVRRPARYYISFVVLVAAGVPALYFAIHVFFWLIAAIGNFLAVHNDPLSLAVMAGSVLYLLGFAVMTERVHEADDGYLGMAVSLLMATFWPFYAALWLATEGMRLTALRRRL